MAIADRHAKRSPQVSGSRAGGSPGTKRCAIERKSLNPIVQLIHDVQRVAEVYRDSKRSAELANCTAGAAPLPQHGSIGPELHDAVERVIGDVHVSVTIHGDACRSWRAGRV